MFIKSEVCCRLFSVRHVEYRFVCKICGFVSNRLGVNDISYSRKLLFIILYSGKRPADHCFFYNGGLHNKQHKFVFLQYERTAQISSVFQFVRHVVF